MAEIVDFRSYRAAKQAEDAEKAIARQLLEHGIIALPVSYVDLLPCDCEPSYQIEINAPAASLEAPDYSQCQSPTPKPSSPS